MRALALALLTASLVGLVSFLLFFYRPILKITITPQEATFTFGEQSAKGQAQFTVMPGSYELKISYPGFIPLVKSIPLKVAQRQELTINLEPIPKLAKSSEEKIFLAGLSTDKKSALLLADDGTTLFSSSNPSKPLTLPKFDRPSFFSISPAGDAALARNRAGEIILYNFQNFDVGKQSQVSLGSDIVSVDWLNPAGQRLFYSQAPKLGDQSLVLADRSNKSIEKVFDLGKGGLVSPQVKVSPDGKTALLLAKPAGDAANSYLYLFDFSSRNVRKLTTEGNVADARFSPDGKRIVFTRSSQDPLGLTHELLSVIDADGKNRKDFTLRSKLNQVAFLDTAQLVVVQSKPDGDKLARLDLLSGQAKDYYHESTAGIHLDKIVLSGDESFLFATGDKKVHEQYGILYTLKLATDEY